MGSPDARQIDGIGGAHPLTSKVAVISGSARADADVDYLFLQVGVGEAMVSDRQNCGNLLAGVGPFAIERGLVRGAPVRIHMVNSDSVATATFPGADGVVNYDGDTAIAGVPGTAAAVVLDFAGTEGSATGALLPTGEVTDVIRRHHRHLHRQRHAGGGRARRRAWPDRVRDRRRTRGGHRTRAAGAGPAAGRRPADGPGRRVRRLGAEDLPRGRPGGRRDDLHPHLHPRRVHESIGVLGAVSVATALLLDGAAGGDLAAVKPGQTRFDIEHPTGHVEVEVEMDQTSQPPTVLRSGVVRTARKLFDGTVFPRRYS